MTSIKNNFEVLNKYNYYSMNFEIPQSRLFQDLLTLERDFKYNLGLLKIRDAEIERCNKENKVLQETLRLKNKEIEELTSSFSYVQKTLQETEHLRSGEKKICQETVAKLTHNLKETTHKFQLQIESTKNDLNGKQKQLEIFYLSLLEQEKEKYQRHLKAMEERLQNKNNFESITKSQCEAVQEENLSLKNSIKNLKSQYTSDKFISEKDVETLKSVNCNLNTEIEYLKKSYVSLQEMYNEMKYQNNNYQTQSSTLNQKNCKLIKQNKEHLEANDKLKCQIEENENLYKEFILENEQLTNQNRQLELEMKEIKKEINFDKPCCNISNHLNYDYMVNQNQVLRELVKEMRREREKLIERDNETEKRVQNLEELLQMFKRCELIN